MKNKKNTWVFCFHKYGKFWSILGGQNIERKRLFFEVCGIIAREVGSKNMYFVDRENYTTYIHLLLFNGFVYVCLVWATMISGWD